MRKIKELYNTLQSVAFGWSWKKVDRKKRAGIAFFRMLWITLKGFSEDLVTLRASSLTYITMVSIIPTIAFSLAIAKGIGVDNTLINMVNEFILEFELQEEIVAQINEVIKIVQNVDYGKMGAAGFLVMALSVIKLLGKIEHSLNDIWGVKQHRTLMRKFSDYISIVVMIPVLIVASTTITVFLSSADFLAKTEAVLGSWSFIVQKAMSFSGLFTIILAFFLLYIWLPNTRVRIPAALVGGVVGGVSWKLMLLIFVKSQSGLSGANPIYGTFAAIPLLLVWLYMSWVIVLFGAEVAFSVQHWQTYELNVEEKELNFSSSMTLALIIMQGVAKSFREGVHWCPDRFSDENSLSVKSVLAVTDVLSANGLLEVNPEPELHFVPARMVEKISVGDVIRAVAGEEFSYLQSAEQLKTGLVSFNAEKWENFIDTVSEENLASG